MMKKIIHFINIDEGECINNGGGKYFCESTQGTNMTSVLF